MHRYSSLILLIALIAIGCRTPQLGRALNVPTPEVEYSEPVFHPTFEPPAPPSPSAPAAAAMPSGNVVLSWNYPTNELATNLVFKIYGTNLLNSSFSNWPVLTNATGTNLSIPIRIVPGPFFFVMTASNFWGESDFSAVASTPALPRSDVNLRITRGTP